MHGVGNIRREYEPGEQLYWIKESDLGRVLDLVKRHPRFESIRLTFDDGNSSDYEIAVPALRKRGLKASFFVLGGRLNQSGYLSKAQVRELADEGFEIGSHGLRHVDWTKVNDEILQQELKGSKEVLEDAVGRPVNSASIPFGRYDRRVLRALSHCGYLDIFSSDGGPRLTKAWPVPRYSLRREVDLGALSSRITADASPINRIRNEARLVAKASLARSTLVGVMGAFFHRC